MPEHRRIIWSKVFSQEIEKSKGINTTTGLFAPQVIEFPKTCFCFGNRSSNSPWPDCDTCHGTGTYVRSINV